MDLSLNVAADLFFQLGECLSVILLKKNGGALFQFLL